MSTTKGLEFQAGIPDAIDGRNASGVSLEASRTQQLARQAYVRDRWDVAVTKIACAFV